MRSTKATAAVERLKKRSGNDRYSLMRSADGTFCLMLDGDAAPVSQGAALPIDEFVKFVNAIAPEKPKRVSKFDLAFEAQLAKMKNERK
jgi:hypothetical protein